MEAFDIDAVWYGGPEGLENNPQTQISFLKVSREKKKKKKRFVRLQVRSQQMGFREQAEPLQR